MENENDRDDEFSGSIGKANSMHDCITRSRLGVRLDLSKYGNFIGIDG